MIPLMATRIPRCWRAGRTVLARTAHSLGWFESPRISGFL